MKRFFYRMLFLTVVLSFSSLTVLGNDEIAISSVTDLQKIGNDSQFPLTGSYYLTSNIDLSGISDWIPIGAKSLTDAAPAFFEGIFDGRGFTIKNLKIVTYTDLKGLFGNLQNATVKNLLLEVNISGQRQLGAVAGSIQGRTLIERVGVKGSITGLENVGGIIGRVQLDNAANLKYNTVKDCYVNATIKSTTTQAGGIAGRANGRFIVENVYVAGKIEAAATSAAQFSAGIVPYFSINFVQILASAVVADEIKGGSPNLFYTYENQRYLEYFEDLYARNDINLTYFDAANKGTGQQIVKSSMLLDPQQFKTQSFYENTLKWDFDNVWTMGADGYPAFKGIAPAVDKKVKKIKVACIGNSITEDLPLSYYDKYPTKLQQMLGSDKYAVRNYGTGGTCMLKASSTSYWNLPRFLTAQEWNPDILIIKLGTNDTQPVNWEMIANYESDYLEFINIFKTLNPQIKVFVCYPIPVLHNDNADNILKDSRVRELAGKIDRIAKETGATVINLYDPLVGGDNVYYRDFLHPNPSGSSVIANTIYNKLRVTALSAEPIAISNVDDLQKIGRDAAYPLDGKYYLTADIDLAGVADWIPIGATTVTDANPAFFKGTFDGKGYSIKNLKVTTATDFKGLFGRLYNATVKDFDLVNVDIKGGATIGGVSAAILGQTRIDRVSVSGNVQGTNEVGGIAARVGADATLIGYNIIKDCYVSANVSSTLTSINSNVGGIVSSSKRVVATGDVPEIYGKIDISNVYVSGKIKSAWLNNSANSNAAGILTIFEDHKYVKMSEVIVLSDEIAAGTPNYFFCRRGVTAENLTLLEKLYVRENLPLTYFNAGDKGYGAVIPANRITTLPLDTYKTAQFYANNLSWDFNNVWTIQEGSLPVLKRTAGEDPTSIAPQTDSKQYELIIKQGALTIVPQSEITLQIFNVSGVLVYKADKLASDKTIYLPAGAYIVQSISKGKISTEKIIIR